MLRARIARAGYSSRYPAIVGIDIRAEPGDIIAVLGPSGSGKTTLLKVLAGVVPYVESGYVDGYIEYRGIDITTMKPRCRPIAYLPQDPSEMVLGDTGLEMLKLFGVAPSQAPLDISELLRKRVNEMSSGQLQKLVIASVLGQGRDVLLLDEPLANLDALSSRDALEAVIGVAKRGGIAVVAEHRVSRIASYASKILVLDKGKQLYYGENIEQGLRIAEEVGVREASSWVPRLDAPCRELDVDPVVLAERLTIGYGGKPILRDLTFLCPRRSIVAIVGPNGSGKTTLLRALAGVLKPMNGIVRYAWGSWSWREIGWVPPNPWLGFSRSSVGEEIYSVARRAGLQSYESWCRELLEMLGLSSYVDRRPWELSSGERMRLAIAKALAKKPTLVLLDEPLRGQDRRFAEAVFSAVRDVIELRGGCAAIVTHDIEFLSFVDYVYRIDRGCFLSGRAIRIPS